MIGMDDIRKDFKAVIFDLDGTLLNTLDDLADSMNTVLKENGFPVHAVPDYKFLVGKGITVLVEKAVPDGHRDPETVSRLEKRMREVYAGNWDNKTKPYSGIPELLDELTERKVSINILSNKPHEYTLITVKRYLEKWHFGMVLGAQASMPIKPSPEGALFIAQTLGLDYHDIAYVGDTDVDMETAHAAGMFPAGALWGFRTEEELFSSGALAVFNKPMDLLKLWGDSI